MSCAEASGRDKSCSKACSCTQCKIEFRVAAEDLEFYERAAPLFAGQKFLIPLPTLCPKCRQQRRCAWRNERVLYSDTCDLCHKKTISIFSPDKPYKVYCQECWWSDSFDPLAFGLDYDPNKTFFEQYHELQLRTPRVALYDLGSENDFFCNHSAHNKNCYMCLDGGEAEDCLYGKWVLRSRDCIDTLHVSRCEACYECSYCQNCFQAFYCQYCEGVSDSLFCFECKNCSSCIGCTQLQNKHHYILNQRVSEEEFQRTKKELLTSRQKLEEFRRAFADLKLKAPRKYSRQVNCTDSVGDNLYNCKNAIECFDCRELEDCKYMFDLGNNKNSMDCFEHGYLVPSELNYECHGGMSGYHLLFCNICAYGRDLLYCDLCFNNTSHLFGCISLKQASYCILNKQYSPDDYERIASEIIKNMQSKGEWGEFFPARLSPFGYNETLAHEFFPLSRAEALAAGFTYSDYEPPDPQVARTVLATELPEDVVEAADDTTDAGIKCEVTEKLFRITKQELKFYRTHGLPLPPRHPDQRYLERAHLQWHRTVYRRQCEQCQGQVWSTYAPEAPEKVFCEACYLKAVY